MNIYCRGSSKCQAPYLEIHDSSNAHLPMELRRDLGVREFRCMKCDPPLVREAEPAADNPTRMFDQEQGTA